VVVAEWIVALAGSGSGALVGAAAEDAWGSARDGIVGLFRRAGADRQARLEELLDALGRWEEALAATQEAEALQQQGRDRGP
jgi:hypothetical protein